MVSSGRALDLGHVYIVSDHFASDNVPFSYEMLLSSQFLQRTGGSAVRSSKWCAVYRFRVFATLSL